MTDGTALKEAIQESGLTITFIANKMGCSRNRIYAIISGADCTASEIAILTTLLHLTKEQRDKIFLTQKVN